MKDNEEIITGLVYHLDSLVTTINPDLNAPVPNHHPCQKNYIELYNDLQNYIELINKLQKYI